MCILVRKYKTMRSVFHTPKIFTLLCASLLVSNLMVGCSDDSADKLSEKTELLIKDNWILLSSTIDPPVSILGNTLSDVYALVPACDRDNFAKYKSDQTGIYDEGATKCESQDPQTVAFNWSFKANETQIQQDGDLLNVLELTETTLKVRFPIDGTEYGIPGTTFQLTNTYRH